MNFEWTSKPTDDQYRAMRALYGSLAFVHVDQYPGWDLIERRKQATSYCMAYDQSGLKGYVMITEHPPLEARVTFGPVCKQVSDSLSIIVEMIRYFKAKGLFSLRILLGMEVGHESQLLKYQLVKQHPFTCRFDKNNKGSIRLRLDDCTEEELLAGMSQHHRRAIAKGKKEGLESRILVTAEEILAFSEGYRRMLQSRKISCEEGIDEAFQSVQRWLADGRNGFFMGVFHEGKMVGGLLMIYRGAYAEYYRGFTLPAECQLPINHFGFFEAIKVVKSRNYTYFDLGGYNLLVDEKDQVNQINRFKKGFNGEPFFYPMTIYVDLRPAGAAITRAALKLKRLFNSFGG
jgi:hypothetical protein